MRPCGGPPVPIEGDNAGALAQITRTQPATIVETDLSATGERDAILSMQMMPDGRTIRGTARMPKADKTATFFLRRVE